MRELVHRKSNPTRRHRIRIVGSHKPPTLRLIYLRENVAQKANAAALASVAKQKPNEYDSVSFAKIHLLLWIAWVTNLLFSESMDSRYCEYFAWEIERKFTYDEYECIITLLVVYGT